MDERDEIVGVRVDSAEFRREVADMRQLLEGSLGGAGDRAGRAIERSLLGAVRQGRVGFEELKGAGLRAVDAIAGAALKAGIREVAGSGGLGRTLGTLLAGLSGLPGRATGGPVAPGRPYLVGERGPELFVPTAAGRVEAGVRERPREVRVAITVNAGTVNAGTGEAAGALRQSARQVARAVRAALAEE